MRLQFEPGHGAGPWVADQLVQQVARWAAERGSPELHGEALRAALRVKARADGDLGRWTSEDLVEVMLQSVDDGGDQVATAVAELRLLIDFLAWTGQLTEGSDQPRTLHTTLEELAPILHHVLPQAGDADEDRPSAPERYPPVLIPPPETLATAASDTLLLRRLIACVDFVGDGLRVTDKGNLRLADGRTLVTLLDSGDVPGEQRLIPVRSSVEYVEADRVFRIALAMGVLRRQGNKVVPVAARAKALRSDPYRSWADAVVTLLDLGILTHRYRDDMPPWGVVIDHSAVELLAALYGDEPVPVDDLVSGLRHAIEPYLAEGLEPGFTTAAFEDFAESATVLEEAGVLIWDEHAATLGLTPLGTALTQELLREAGHELPLVGELASADAATLLSMVAAYPPREAEAELRGWVAARPGTATQELAAGLRSLRGNERIVTGLALEILGEDAARVAETLLDDPDLRPYARLWQAAHGLTRLDESDRLGTTTMLVEILAMIVRFGDPEDAVVQLRALASDDQHALLDIVDNLWQVDSPYTGDVLAALADADDKPIAKAARRAQFRSRRRSRRTPAS